MKKIWTINLLFLMIFALPINAEIDKDAKIIQPGAPGKPSNVLDAETAIAIANTSYTRADVDFLTGMIVHHDQALVMSELAPERTNNKSIIDLAGRIEVSQEDEISFMEDWLFARDEQQSDNNHNHMHMKMAGMATPQQLDALENSKGKDFDRLF